MPVTGRVSLAVRVAFGLVVMVLLMASVAAYAAWTLSVNRGSYDLLAAVNQLEVSLRALERRADNYAEAAPRTYPDYERDLLVYNRHLQDDLAFIESTIERISRKRDVSADDLLDPLPTGSLDRDLETLLAEWRSFRAGLQDQLGDDPDEPRLEWGAEFIGAQADPLIQSANRLAATTRDAVQSRRERVIQFGVWGGIGAAALAGLLVLWFYRAVIRRIRGMTHAFDKATTGRLDLRLDAGGSDELADLAWSFNRMSARLHGLIRLLDRLQRGSDPETTLSELWVELREMMDVDYLALMEMDPSGLELRIRHQELSASTLKPEGQLNLDRTTLLDRMESDGVLYLPDLATTVRDYPDCDLAVSFRKQGLGSAILLALPNDRNERLVMITASRRTSAFDEELTALLRNLSHVIGHAFDKSAYAERLLLAVVNGLAKLAERRDPETGDHVLRMGRYSGIIAEELSRRPEWKNRLNGAFARDVERFAPLHDIGKVGIDDRILLKKGRLSEHERSEMQRHPIIGGEVLRHCARQMGSDGERVFGVAIDIAEAHHEKYDGSGYPRGLEADRIPPAARIIAAADVFDALTSKRPYKPAWTVDEALAFMRDQAGRHFDPAVLDAMESGMDRIMAVYERHRHV